MSKSLHKLSAAEWGRLYRLVGGLINSHRLGKAERLLKEAKSRTGELPGNFRKFEERLELSSS